MHRVLGRPGVILVGEGAPHRVKPLLAQEKKRVPGSPATPRSTTSCSATRRARSRIRKLNNHLVKLPRNLNQQQVNALEKRVAALGGTKAAPLPKGPMPTKARTSGLERTMRRR